MGALGRILLQLPMSQVDLFGLACTAFRVLTGRPLAVRKSAGRWLPMEDLETFWTACAAEGLPSATSRRQNPDLAVNTGAIAVLATNFVARS